MNIFPICYFPSVPWLAAACTESIVHLEVAAHYRKQQITNRTHIRVANRILPLTVPIVRRGARVAIKEKKISYAENWQKHHCRSLESAYRNAPYYEYFIDQVKETIMFPHVFLVDLLEQSIFTLRDLAGYTFDISYSENYLDASQYTADYRKVFDPTLGSFPSWFVPYSYPQVFPGFSPGLSSLDLLFNMGPECRIVLQNATSG